MSILRTLLLTAALVAVIAPAAVAGEKGAMPAERMVAKINKVRAKHDLQPLRTAPKLMRSSRDYARHLIRTDTFAHGSSYAKAGFETTGETLAFHRGQMRRPWPILRMWLASPAHRALILSASFSHVGAGLASGRFDGVKATIWVARFGAR